MKKVELDEFEVRLLVTDLYQTRDRYADDIWDTLDDIILRLIDEHETMKPCRKRKLPFEPGESSLIAKALILWRNDIIDQGKPTEDIDRLLTMFVK